MSKAMFAGIFLVVGWGSVEGNGIVHKTLFLLRDPTLTPREHPLHDVRKSSILKFVGIQWLFFAMIIAVSETLGELQRPVPLLGSALTLPPARRTAGIGFPVIITLLIPLRHFYVPRLFTPDELCLLDAPTANSAAVLVSLGGPLQPEHGSTSTEGHRFDGEDERASRGKEGVTGARLRRRGTREHEEELGLGAATGEAGLQKTTSITR